MSTQTLKMFRPVKGRIYIETPYLPGNRDWFKNLGIRPIREDGYWRVSRKHLLTLIDEGHERFGKVEIWTDHRSQTTCDTRCQSALPYTVDECVCSCMGMGHAGGNTGWNPNGSFVVIDTEVVRTHWTVQKEES